MSQPPRQLSDEALLTEIYSSFEPFKPPVKEAYVDCQEVRGRWDVVRELGRRITRSKEPTCQLYTGHRGVGKSTELLRLKEFLEGQGYFVVYFAADNEDIEPQDAEYADILFACTRHLVQDIRVDNHNPLVQWLQERWDSMKELARSEVQFDGLTLEGQIAQFGSISSTLRAIPEKRREIRQKVNDYTPSLVVALNDFIGVARSTLPNTCPGIVIMADNLDRIVEIQQEGQPSNYDEIYLNRSEILRGLDCHVIYTVPISMVYSERGTRLEDNYDKPDVLPMVMVRYPDGRLNAAGLAKFRELIQKRVALIDADLADQIDTQLFDSPATLENLCLMSGGHLRILMQLIQRAIDWTDCLPITAQAVQIAIEEARETYLNTIQADQWRLLAQVCRTRNADNEPQCLRLLLNRCLLEYRYYDDQGKLQRWHNVHPLIEGLAPFQKALAQVPSLPFPWGEES
ncbi:MAG: ATP-binding protein [Tildeniella torsiva UHER 1998/13D]|jgi:hypothetical protein|nr:ATP-binding protein [Tildeniella torsiva UHER 1998/13D]